MGARSAELTAVEAAYLASACIEASRDRDAPASRVLAALAIRFDPDVSLVSLRAVRKALEEGVVPSQDPDRVRLDRTAVLYLVSTQSLEGALLNATTKARIYDAIRTDSELVELAPMVNLDLSGLLRLCKRVVKSYADRLNRYIVTDPEIMGGVPLIRNTRIPVYTILGRIEEGETLDDIAEDFDHVPREALETALAYARTHPRRGRPKQFR